MNNEKSINFEESIKEILDKDKDFIKEEVNKQLKQRIIDGLAWHMQDEVTEIVKEFFETDLKDEVLATLKDHKGEILDQIKQASINISAEVAKAMTKKAVENLTSSYKSNSIIKSLFE